MSHICHAKKCKSQVAPTLFMCKTHWYMVPKFLQAQIWKYYRPGQEIDKQPSGEYINAAMEAVNYVVHLERENKK